MDSNAVTTDFTVTDFHSPRGFKFKRDYRFVNAFCNLIVLMRSVMCSDLRKKSVAFELYLRAIPMHTVNILAHDIIAIQVSQ